MKTGDSSNTRTAADRPAVDEWGIYDPSQAGLSALFDRIEENSRGVDLYEALQVAASMQHAKRLASDGTKK